ncbi:histidine phosphatase family protein [Pseudoramibacter faecis]|uniref:histidine phosphatase family protein n=1 Tax=Pseudoramibacter faecis TaxID=3108534 RepID=UPI002E7833FD|nr:histidine phosphatase family protein [Pseudoramibacter sp. HA2172]
MMRHGETVGNVQRRYLGKSESPLTPVGEATSAAMAERLVAMDAECKIDRIYTSPRQRTRQVADRASARLSCPMTVREELREMDFGIFERLTAGEAEAKAPAIWAAWMADFAHYRLPGGESADDVMARVRAFIRRVQASGDGSIAVITHGGIVRSLLTALLALPPEAGWHFEIPLGGFAIVDCADGYGILKGLGRVDIDQ